MRPPKTIPAPLAYSIAEFVVVSGLGRTTLYAEAKGGRLRLTKCGARTLILADDARAFLDSLREAA